MAPKQLNLLPPARKRPERRAAAQRDWSKAEFTRALDRNGFEHFGGLRFADVSGDTDMIFTGVVTRSLPVRIDRRATLAKILRERELASTSKPKRRRSNG